MTTINDKVAALGAATLLGTFAHDSDDWHNARKGIGGSDIGTIAGLNPWNSAYTLFMQKTGRIPGITANTAMRLGSAFEKPIRDLWAADNAGFLTVYDTGTWQSNLAPEFKANPDGFIEWRDGTLGVLEIKYTSERWKQLPEHYRAQVTWYMIVTGLRRAILVAVAGRELNEYEVTYDAEYANRLKLAARRFLNHLSTDTAPDYDGSNSTYETVRELHPEITPGEVELPDDLAANLLTAKRHLEAAEDALRLYKTVTLKYLDGTQTGTLDGVPVVKLSSKSGGKPFITFK